MHTTAKLRRLLRVLNARRRQAARASAAATAAVVMAPGPSPQAQMVIDLAELGTTHPGFRIEGIDRDDFSGFSVSGAGDVNGDGLSDLIVGARSADPNDKNGAGESYIVFGKTDGTIVDLEVLGLGGFRIDGNDPFDGSGFSVSGAGDVNGDGLADAIVGAFGADPGGDSSAGESYVVFGKTDATVIDLGALDVGGFRIDGIDALDRSGYSVSGAGDVNGDGLADLIVGARSPTPGSNTPSTDEIYVIFGKTDGTAIDLEVLGNRGFRIDGIDVYDSSGRSVSGAGDVNGDGLADLIIGAYHAYPGGKALAGESYVVFGKTNSTPISLATLGAGGFRIDGIDALDRSGYSVSGAGDVNGDGLADVIIGAWAARPGGNRYSGESYVVFGKTDGATVDLSTLGTIGDTGGFRIDGINAFDQSGRSVAGAGDVNGDGLADVIVGARWAFARAGESYVVFGKSDSASIDLEALDSRGFRVDGVDHGTESGISVSGAGDVNGDGLADLIVGAYRASPGGTRNAGESYVVFSPETASESAPYRAFARAGDAPNLAIGVTGDGSNDSTPDSRAWIDFDAGDNREGAASLQTVTIHRGLNLGPSAATTAWEVTTDRTGWTSAALTFKFTEAEIAGLVEDDLLLFRAQALEGPWMELPTTLDLARNHIGTVETMFGVFAIATGSGPAPPVPLHGTITK